MTEHKIREAMGYLEPALVQEASQSVAHKRKRLRPMLVAACLAALCAVSVAARVYTGWTVGEVTRFDAMEALEERGWASEDAPDSFWERNGQYEIWPQAEHEAYPFAEEVTEMFPREYGNKKVYFDSIVEMNAALKLDILDSPLLKQVSGEQLWMGSCCRDGDKDKFYLLGGQYFNVEGYEELYCAVAFTVWGYNGIDIAFGASAGENNYTFSQIEIENLQVTAECMENKDQDFDIVNVFFTKDAVSYTYLFSCKEEVDMSAVTAVLESLE